MEPLFSLIKGPHLVLCKFEGKESSKTPTGGVDIELGLKVTGNLNKKKDQLRLNMITNTLGSAGPFNFEVAMEAVFAINKKMADDKIHDRAKIECSPFVFGVLRDFIADLTRRSSDSPLYLPVPDLTKAMVPDQETRPTQKVIATKRRAISK